MELDTSTTRGTFRVIKEYNVRQVLRPVNYLDGGKPIVLQCFDGSVRRIFPSCPVLLLILTLKETPKERSPI